MGSTHVSAKRERLLYSYYNKLIVKRMDSRNSRICVLYGALRIGFPMDARTHILSQETILEPMLYINILDMLDGILEFGLWYYWLGMFVSMSFFLLLYSRSYRRGNLGSISL